jgi:uncharacterized protein YqcC (DUF446 family)
MKAAGLWSTDALAEEKMQFHGPFGIGCMSFEEWLQFIFIQRVRTIIDTIGVFPQSSGVYMQAYREWVMYGPAPGY